MPAHFKAYTPADYLRVRDFLIETYGRFGAPFNWTIERWNFCRHMGQVMHQTSAEWEATAGIWEDDQGVIVAVVHSEGEENGEAYFQLRSPDLPDELLAELFAHAEERLAAVIDGRRLLRLFVPDGHRPREVMAQSRGYARQPRGEVVSGLPVAQGPDPTLPPGFFLRDGTGVADGEKGHAHGRAFGYLGTEYEPRSARGYGLLRQAPDYRPDLDLYAVTGSGEIAAFGTMWLDRANRIGMLEPLGTVPEFRGLGLDRALIGEGLRRLEAEGATRVVVGSADPFYQSLGFAPAYTCNLWLKVL